MYQLYSAHILSPCPQQACAEYLSAVPLYGHGLDHLTHPTGDEDLDHRSTFSSTLHSNRAALWNRFLFVPSRATYVIAATGDAFSSLCWFRAYALLLRHGNLFKARLLSAFWPVTPSLLLTMMHVSLAAIVPAESSASSSILRLESRFCMLPVSGQLAPPAGDHLDVTQSQKRTRVRGVGGNTDL